MEKHLKQGNILTKLKFKACIKSISLLKILSFYKIKTQLRLFMKLSLFSLIAVSTNSRRKGPPAPFAFVLSLLLRGRVFQWLHWRCLWCCLFSSKVRCCLPGPVRVGLVAFSSGIHSRPSRDREFDPAVLSKVGSRDQIPTDDFWSVLNDANKSENQAFKGLSKSWWCFDPETYCGPLEFLWVSARSQAKRLRV